MPINKAQREILSKLTREGLLDFIDLLQRNWWTLQNNWMAYINREYGEAAAVKGDSHCFGASARAQMYRLRKMFGLKDDIQSLMDAMVLSTIWANGDYDIWKVDPTHFRIRVTNCYQQVRRLEEGMGVLPCKPAGIAICEAALEVMNPKAKVKCLFCPPDERPPDAWCDWEFEVPNEG